MGNKIGFHLLKAAAMAELGDAKMAVMKFVGDWGSAQFVPEGVLVIGRRCESRDAQFQMNQGKSPEEAAIAYVGWQLETYTSNIIQYWEGHNEPVGGPTFMAWYAQFEIARMKIMAGYGYRCVIGNFATGTPDMELWQYFLPALQEAPKYKAILGLHEYSCPYMWWMYGPNQLDPNEHQGDEGWTTCRYRKVIRQVLEPSGLEVPIVITECGIDPGVNPKPPGAPAGTWKELGDYWMEQMGEPDKAAFYADQLIWYENRLQEDDLVVGYTIFTLGSFANTLWSKFDIAGTDVITYLKEVMSVNPADDFEYYQDEPDTPDPVFPLTLLQESFSSDDGFTHRCQIFDEFGKNPYWANIGEAFVPKNAEFAYWRHLPGIYDQPECGYIWGSDYPERVLSDMGAYKWFWTGRMGEGGLAYEVETVIGDLLQADAFGHAWSNHNLIGYDECFEDPFCSAGVGTTAAVLYEKDIPPLGGDTWSDALGNAKFQLGMDPTGGDNPFADTVIWGPAAYIYNKYAPIPSVQCIAEAEVMTVFVKYVAMWKFKHNDFYLDELTVKLLDIAPEVVRGLPRIQYPRTYVLLPPRADANWARAAISGSWDKRRWTIGNSADDAGIGDLDARRVVAVNPNLWPDNLREFYNEHYPGVVLVEVFAETPSDLVIELWKLDGGF